MKLFLHSVTLDKFYVLLYGSKQVWGIFGEEEHKICAVVRSEHWGNHSKHEIATFYL